LLLLLLAVLLALVMAALLLSSVTCEVKLLLLLLLLLLLRIALSLWSTSPQLCRSLSTAVASLGTACSCSRCGHATAATGATCCSGCLTAAFITVEMLTAS
jgi:hypothetical protein